MLLFCGFSFIYIYVKVHVHTYMYINFTPLNSHIGSATGPKGECHIKLQKTPTSDNPHHQIFHTTKYKNNLIRCPTGRCR